MGEEFASEVVDLCTEHGDASLLMIIFGAIAAEYVDGSYVQLGEESLVGVKMVMPPADDVDELRSVQLGNGEVVAEALEESRLKGS